LYGVEIQMTEEEIKAIVRETVKEVIEELGGTLSKAIVKRGLQLIFVGIISWIAVHFGFKQ